MKDIKCRECRFYHKKRSCPWQKAHTKVGFHTPSVSINDPVCSGYFEKPLPPNDDLVEDLLIRLENGVGNMDSKNPHPNSHAGYMLKHIAEIRKLLQSRQPEKLTVTREEIEANAGLIWSQHNREDADYHLIQLFEEKGFKVVKSETRKN